MLGLGRAGQPIRPSAGRAKAEPWPVLLRHVQRQLHAALLSRLGEDDEQSFNKYCARACYTQEGRTPAAGLVATGATVVECLPARQRPGSPAEPQSRTHHASEGASSRSLATNSGAQTGQLGVHCVRKTLVD